MDPCEEAIANCDICQADTPWQYGSHYHCAQCGGVTGMYGHYNTGRFVDGKWRRFKDGEGRFRCKPGFEEAELA